ncbi:MAG: NF038143 family protein [Desulfobacterales bacterium]
MKKKFDFIQERDRRLAKSVSLKVIKPKPISVWEMLIPVIFILSYMRAKDSREIFAQNLLFTKKLALEAAFDMVKKGDSREAVMDAIKTKTDDLLTSLPSDVYSNDIRREQMKEIDLLIEHYCKLMQSKGDDYSSLVVDAYRKKDSYATFQKRLKAAEKRVSQVARQTLGNKADSEMAERIETATEKFRFAEVERIFSPHLRR